MPIEVANNQKRLHVDRREIARLVRYALDREHSPKHASVAVLSREAIVLLNAQHLGRREETDVLAFRLDDSLDTDYLGEVIVCADVAADEAARRGLDTRAELYLYVVHGLLHLLGWDDSTASTRAAMNRRARRIVRDFLETAR